MTNIRTVYFVIISSTDINECSVSKGQCDDTCHNTNGSYYCTCNIGFLLLEDQRGCTGLFMII